MAVQNSVAMDRRSTDSRFATRVAHWERLTDAVTPVLLDAARLRPGERVLDIGCGTGAATLRMAGAVGERGTVTAVDISPPVIEWATRRAAESGVTNVSFVVDDAQRGAFPGGPFSAALSQFGVMFFDDPVAGFANIRRHLADGGRLCFTCWQAAGGNPWSFAATLASLLPAPPTTPPGLPPPGPFALADEARLRTLLRAAGFAQVDVVAHRTTVHIPEDTVVDDTELALMGVTDEHLDEARGRVAEQLAPYRGADLLHMPLAFFAVTAR